MVFGCLPSKVSKLFYFNAHMIRPVENETGNCQAAIKEAYGFCSNMVKPVMKEVADVETLIDDKYLSE
jgi:hypothetical protein